MSSSQRCLRAVLLDGNVSHCLYLEYKPVFGIKKLKQYPVDIIGAGGGVSEPGLNRWPDTNCT